MFSPYRWCKKSKPGLATILNWHQESINPPIIVGYTDIDWAGTNRSQGNKDTRVITALSVLKWPARSHGHDPSAPQHKTNLYAYIFFNLEKFHDVSWTNDTELAENDHRWRLFEWFIAINRYFAASSRSEFVRTTRALRLYYSVKHRFLRYSLFSKTFLTRIMAISTTESKKSPNFCSTCILGLLLRGLFVGTTSSIFRCHFQRL